MTTERLKEKQNSDPDEETRNGSCSFGFQRTYSESNFFDLSPANIVAKPRSTFHKNQNTVHEEADESDQSDEPNKNEHRQIEVRRRKTHTLV